MLKKWKLLKQLDAMDAKFSSDNVPLCPDCKQPMDYDRPKGRDTETMGGYSVQYFTCTCGDFQLIDSKRLYPA